MVSSPLAYPSRAGAGMSSGPASESAHFCNGAGPPPPPAAPCAGSCACTGALACRTDGPLTVCVGGVGAVSAACVGTGAGWSRPATSQPAVASPATSGNATSPRYSAPRAQVGFGGASAVGFSGVTASNLEERTLS